MTKKLILHVPHSSDVIPSLKGYVVGRDILDAEMLKLTDWFTDDLFDSPEDVLVKAEFSRVFCDPERFADDSQEVMAALGMGVLYEKSDSGSKIRELNAEDRAEILDTYYWPHHQRLGQAVNQQLEFCDIALIVDCHSFPSVPFSRDLDQRLGRPDFNIGTDAFHTPDFLIGISEEFFLKKGYSLGIDWPYRGSLVPLEYYQKDRRVASIMLEVNRALYLQEPSNEESSNYQTIKKVVREYLEMLKKAFWQ